MSLQIASNIAAYFDASNARDAKKVAACFTPDAVVVDEGHERKGIPAILEWKDWAEKKYQPVSEVLGSEDAAGKTVVQSRVSGTFPGSPVVLKFEFTLEGGKIVRLQVVS
ncbi:MAG TPA: nuclear transport factor 2 family protein [Xanthobacteraceae bacterium]|nr:nuclear transport factor 2 family protein [Xanthobacteraceae bacterium]